jgi:hypothetical protein
MANPYDNNPFKTDDNRDSRSEYDANRAIKEGIVSREELDDPHGEWIQWTVEYLGKIDKKLTY